MLTIEQILASLKAAKSKPGEEDLRRLPDRKALIKGRLSSPTQVRESKQSLREIARLVSIAIGDGYKTGLEPAAIEKWLEDIRLGLAKPGIREDGDVIVECLGLGVSGTLPEGKRPDLAYDMELLRSHAPGAIYVTEGANRLARDRDGVTSATLLKLMKETNCKLRTPEEVLSPCIERDWQIIHDELEKGAEELIAMRRRLFRRKVLKAEAGGFVGEPIPAGFILPKVGQAPDGKYEFGKMTKYAPHAEVVVTILREYVKQGGSELETAQALAEVTFPAFEEEFRYMEHYSSLRRCPKKKDGDRIIGYYITPRLVRGLATNPKIIGIWHWGDIIKADNHDKVAPVDLWLMAYELAIDPEKPRGRAVRHEPLEYSRLLWCYDHEEPKLVYSRSEAGAYLCERDYRNGRGQTCFQVAAHFIDKPLTTEVLSRLDFTPYAEEVLANLEAEASSSQREETQRKRDQASLEQEIKRWKALLPSCVALGEGRVDREREEYYWAQIREAEGKLATLKAKPVLKKGITAVDVQVVRQFLSGLRHKWASYPRGLRNRVLRLLIERVELRHTGDTIIKATVIWKVGLVQEITIYLPPARYARERRWSPEEDELLKMLWQSSTREVIQAALPNRTWSAMGSRAWGLGLERNRTVTRNGVGFRWRIDEDVMAQSLYEAGVPVAEMVRQLGRSRNSIATRASHERWQRPSEARLRLGQVRWEADTLKVLQESSSYSRGRPSRSPWYQPQRYRRNSPLP